MDNYMIQILIDSYPELKFRKISNNMVYSPCNDLYVQVGTNYTTIVNYSSEDTRLVHIFEHIENLYKFLDHMNKSSDNSINLFTYSH